ncbi:site-specific integrase [Paenibacillus woosongensis]|uniref:Site-specific integrase n=1 Tax=Paenibacillus woosongensis TaxID=307580 RepID=A0ABQ4MRQ2_9BACL|nr:site-specific integrase [Paenibacillus woosongensis]GIP58681.1 site-specific integrase [Paenibacillus woosongensis]
MKGHVAKKGNKYYIVIDLERDEITGKRKQKWLSGYEKKRDANKALPIILADLMKGNYVEPTKKTFRELMLNYLEDKKTSVKHGTWKSYEWLVKTHIIPNVGNIQAIKLKPQHLHDLYHKILFPKLSVSSIKKVHVIIHDALNRAVVWGLVTHNVSQYVDLPQGQKTKFLVWNEQQLQIFLDAAKDDQYFEAFELAASTGMRQSEILALSRTDIDLKRKVASVRQAYTLSEDGGHSIQDTKTESSVRPIALFPHTVELLEKLFEKHENQKTNNKLYKDSGLVIQTSVGTPVGPRNLMRNYYKILDRIQKENPEFPRIRFQDLRHTHATLLLKAGIHPKIVQERLGHSSITVTIDTYSHVLPNLQEAVLNNMGDSITGSSRSEIQKDDNPTLFE